MNNKLKKIITLVLILSMVFTFAACSGDNALAKIKDRQITEEQLDGYISYYALLSLSSSKEDLGENELNYLKGIVLNFAVEVELLKQHYDDKGETVLPDDYDDQFSQYKESLFSQSENMESQLSEAGVNNDSLEFFFSAQFYTKKFMEDINTEDPVTEDEIETYYNEHKEEFVSPAQIRASHILIKDEEHTAESKKEIEKIKKEIEDGKSFVDAAKEYSDDGSAEAGGDLGWFGKGQMVQEFEDAAFALKKGKMSDVVETEFGYHLILLIDRQKEHQLTLKEAHNDAKAMIEEGNYSDGIESLKNEIGVEYTDAGQAILDNSQAAANSAGS